ncbi:MAG: 1-hydroxycarotenoid 3,4-desaturase CrtD [Flavobacteriales bacterium]
MHPVDVAAAPPAASDPGSNPPEQDEFYSAARPSMTCAVIGSGIAGLASAIRLANAGHSVTVFEANDHPGGKISELRMGGYRFDMGPTVLTMPQYIDELFALCGEDPRRHLRYQRIDPGFQYYFHDGTVIRTWADQERLADEFAANTTADRKSVLTFLERCRVKRELTEEVFLERSLHRLGNYFNKATLRGLLNFHKVEAFTTMAKANAALFKDEKVAAILNQFASYNGSDPYAAPATLNLISYYELALGSYAAEGGMHAITKALTGLAQRQGVRFEMGTRVERIAVDGGTCKGVVVRGEHRPFDRVVSNADVYTAYHGMMPEQRKPRTLDQPRSSSVILFHWGMDRAFPSLHLHNMFMSADGRAEYDHIFNKGTIHPDPSIYLHISSKVNANDAPPGCENWFAMVAVPHNTGQDWDDLVRRTRTTMIGKLSRMLGVDVEASITCEHAIDPRTIEQLTSCAFGAIFGNSSNSVFASFLRHPNFSRRIKDLYFCGGSVHPGPGIPLCLLSAKITAGLVAEEVG